MHSYILDLGLSKNIIEDNSKVEVYRVMSYVTSKVLSDRKFTPAADIYGFRVIMAKMSTEQRLFDSYEFNHELALKIINELQPDEFAPRTSDYYIKLAKRCIDSNPDKWPATKAYNFNSHMEA
jgi:hypothetical protein